MAKPRKMLCNLEAEYTQTLMRLIETQSKITLANWALDYAEAHYLPIYLKHYPDDPRPKSAIDAARDWLAGKVKLPAVKTIILETHKAAREAEAIPSAQAAARAIGQTASTIHAATHSLGLAFYGAAAVAYESFGTQADPDLYERITEEEHSRVTEALRAISIENEPNPAKIKWYC
jgi:hypothetical protein